MTMVRRLGRGWRQLRSDDSGLANIELAFVSTVLMLGLLNGAELGRWYLKRMQVANAVQSATLAVWGVCDTKKLPAKTKCSGLNAAITAGLQSTSLGTGVTLTSGFPTEGYYCVNTSGALQKVAEYTEAKPNDCTAAGSATTKPGDYVMISASYTFQPMFSGITVGGLMPTTMTSTGSMRLQ